MKIAEIKYFDNFDMKEHTNIIDLKKVLYLHYDIEKNYFLAERGSPCEGTTRGKLKKNTSVSIVL